jgi:O-antigen ligase
MSYMGSIGKNGLYAAWCVLVVLCLFFQAKYPTFLVIGILSLIFVTIIGASDVQKTTQSQSIYVFLAVTVALVMPAIFSKMPIVSFSSSIYLLAGCIVLVWIRRELALLLFWALVFYCLVDTFFAFYQMLSIGNSRPNGLFMDSNVRAIYVLVACLFVFSRLSHNPVPLFNTRAYQWILLVILLVGFFSTQSRAMLALVLLSLLSLWTYALLREPEKLKAIGQLTLAAALGFFFFFIIFNLSLDTSIRTIDSKVYSNVRFEMWSGAWELVKQQPVFGHGLGLFRYLYPSVRIETLNAGFFVHNDFLEQWLASGLPGLALTMVPSMYFAYQLLNSFYKSNYHQFLFAGIGLCMIGFSFFNYFFWRLENLIFLASAWKLTDDSIDIEHKLAVTKKIKILVIMLLLYPALVLLAKSDEEDVITSSSVESVPMVRWTDWILVNESQLIPMRVRRTIKQALTGNVDEIDFTNFSITINQIENEIVRGTLYPAFYCARAEIGFMKDESYDEII